MHLYNTSEGLLLHHDGTAHLIESNWDETINRENLYHYLLGKIKTLKQIPKDQIDLYLSAHLLPPVGQQEIWAAGVTYLRSRDARMEESKDAGAADCYQKVYEAERPELFFKATPHRVSGHNQKVSIRKDSTWNVPEPELAIYINSKGNIQGYTIGNDMSSRSIEGENPLYLPQAKIYDKSAALGPGLFVTDQLLSKETKIQLIINRNKKEVFKDSTTIGRMKRSLTELASYLFSECNFPVGCFLMTGTCIVPPADFTLKENDEIHISIDNIGTLINIVGLNSF